MVYYEVRSQPSNRAPHWRSLGYPDRLANQKVKGGALTIAITSHQHRYMIRSTAIVGDMAAERRSLDFGRPGLLAPMPSVAENIGRRPRRKTILVEPLSYSQCQRGKRSDPAGLSISPDAAHLQCTWRTSQTFLRLKQPWLLRRRQVVDACVIRRLPRKDTSPRELSFLADPSSNSKRRSTFQHDTTVG